MRIIKTIFWATLTLTVPLTPSIADESSFNAFATTTDTQKRAKAFDDLLAQHDQAVALLVTKLNACFKKRDERCDNMEALLYLAAALKDKRLVPVLTAMLNDRTYLSDNCIYCCGLTLAMTVYGLHGLWSPPADAKSRNAKVEDATSRIPLARKEPKPVRNELPGHPETEFSRESRKARTLPLEELLRMAEQHSGTYASRVAAAEELSNRSIGDRYLVRLYKALLDPARDESGEFTCYVSEAVSRIEASSTKTK